LPGENVIAGVPAALRVTVGGDEDTMSRDGHRESTVGLGRRSPGAGESASGQSRHKPLPSDVSLRTLDILGTAHQLNNLLVTVSGLAQLLVAKTSDPEVKQDLSTILDQSRRASNLVRALCTVQIQGDVRPECVHVNPLLDDLISEASPWLKVEGVTVEWKPADDLPPVSAARWSLRHVVESLLDNAVDAMRGNEESRRLLIETRRDESDVIVEISDNGHGIDPDVLPRVFDPFFTTRGKDSGMGLGLCVSREVVRRFGGDISISSRKGRGTTVFVRLPAERLSSRRHVANHSLLRPRRMLRRAHGNRKARRVKCTA